MFTNRYWVFAACHTSEFKLSLDLPNGRSIDYCEFVNSSELITAGICGGRPREKPFPVAQLKITKEDFGVDFFGWNGRMVVSEQMRQTMDLNPSDVRYFDIDDSQSKPLARSNNYKIMEIAVSEDISDRERSTYYNIQIVSDWRLKMIEEGHLPPLDKPGFIIRARTVVVREDAAPGTDLFHDAFFDDRPFCTDAFALKVLRSSCTGARFLDPEHLGAASKNRYRTLRGIERHMKWDFLNGTESTRLIRAIE